MPPKKTIVVRSNGFRLWKKKEIDEGRRISLNDIADSTGLALMTVRNFVATEGAIVTLSPLASAVALADYFGVSLNEMISPEVTG